MKSPSPWRQKEFDSTHQTGQLMQLKAMNQDETINMGETNDASVEKKASNYSPNNTHGTMFNKHNVVRKGKGITGMGVSHINQHLAGRLTLGMLQKMKEARMQGESQFTQEEDNEFERVRQLLVN